MGADDPEEREQLEVAATCFHFVFEMMAAELSEGRIFSETLPHACAAFVDTSVEQKACTGAFLQRLFESLEVAETEALSNASMRGYITDMVWPAQGWSRELILGCGECMWRDLPPVALAEVAAVGRCLKSTKQVEDASGSVADRGSS